MDGQILERVKTTKFLGLHFDEHFSWEYHIAHCKKKVSQGVFTINMSKHILSTKHLNILYYSLVNPYLHYGILLWGNALLKYMHGLQILQKKFMRAMCRANYNDPSSPLFKERNILKVHDMYELQTTLFIFRFVNGDLPKPLLDIYQFCRDIHEHNTGIALIRELQKQFMIL